MSVNCVINETGAGRRSRDMPQAQKRPRSGGQPNPSMSTTSTMQSTAGILPSSASSTSHHNNNDHLKVDGGKGAAHYGNSSSMELYFAWFSAITFVGELAIDISLATFYFQGGHPQWALITAAIVLVPLVLCQIYSVVLMRSDYTKGQSVWAPILWHMCLMGLPYRYADLFRRVDSLPSHEVRYKLQEIQAIQTINAILQYCPQCIFQVFIIVHRNYACLFTGITAGLAGFSFAWHLFLQCFSLVQRGGGGGHQEDYRISAGPNFSSNLRVNNLEAHSSSLATILTTTSTAESGSVNLHPSLAEEALALRKNLQILEKNSSMDNRNLVVAAKETKNVDKVKIFQFNKRRPINYQGDDFEFINRIDRLDDSSVAAACDALQNKSMVYYEDEAEEEEEDDLQKPFNGSSDNFMGGGGDFQSSMPRLKRKGICSSQEMLHLVDLMNENISADQIDTLEKSLLDLNGMDCIADRMASTMDNKASAVMMADVKSVAGSRGSEGDAESSNLFKGFPDSLDESTQSSILENIDAAIYENQIIFQERIRKNQLTIQNLKLQDQLLSQFIDLSANGLPSNANLRAILLSLEEQRRLALEGDVVVGVGSGEPDTSAGEDYETMSYVNITRNMSKLKHWRNYVQNIQQEAVSESKVDDLYMVMQPANKNILVETISQINESESPMKQQQIQMRPGGAVGVEFDCGIAGDLPSPPPLAKGRKDGGVGGGGKQVPGLYNIPLDSILESNGEDS